MAKQAKTVELIWRNENYGSISGSLAFRHTVEPYPSETAVMKLHRVFRKAGFKAVESRGAWICGRADERTAARLVELLAEAGYGVEHHGAVPSSLSSETAEPDDGEKPSFRP